MTGSRQESGHIICWIVHICSNINEIMAAEIITKDDLDQFGAKLIHEIKALLSQSGAEPQKWLKSYQVKNMLKISPGTLQNLRMNGTLNFTKIGGILYYKYDDIIRVMEGKSQKKK
ncbi:MAG: helix-turn-helix protein [Mucilaginibacter sp.]|nr:helix-turn-helix protein [Mucilaginibacter sp.]